MPEDVMTASAIAIVYSEQFKILPHVFHRAISGVIQGHPSL